MMTGRRAAALLALLALPASTAWDTCEFSEMPWFVVDQGVGESFAYAIAAINGTMYSGGYTKGNFVYMGVTETGDVYPSPDSRMMFGGTASSVQSLFVAAVDSTGSQTQIWPMKGTSIQKGQIGHGTQTNSIHADTGLQAMQNKMNLAVAGGFMGLLEMPDGSVLSSLMPDGSARAYHKQYQVNFVMKLDIFERNGIGPGTTGWVKIPDIDFIPNVTFAGGAFVSSVDGDIYGNMIVGWRGCTEFEAANPPYMDSRRNMVYGMSKPGTCRNYITKLHAADGSVDYTLDLDGADLSRVNAQCAVTGGYDGEFFCAWTMKTSFGTMNFGPGSNGENVTVVNTDRHTGLIKYNGTGVPIWAMPTAPLDFYQMSINFDGTTLAMVGADWTSKDCPNRRGGCNTNTLARIGTLESNKGVVLWMDGTAGVGSHGLRGVAVTESSGEIFVFGQVTQSETITDADGDVTTLDSYGSYDIFIAAFTVAGIGKYVTQGGGTGMEYFFAMGVDSSTNAIYVGGNTRSETIIWDSTVRSNPMYNGDAGENNPDRNSPVGSSKAIVVKILTTTELPDCLKSCTPSIGIQPSDVKPNYCYINRRCYIKGQHSDYAGYECRQCLPDSTTSATGQSETSALTWGLPADTSKHCYMSYGRKKDWCIPDGTFKESKNTTSHTYYTDMCGVCDVSRSTDTWSENTGCQLLDWSTGEMKTPFYAGVYHNSGAMTMSQPELDAQNQETNETISSLERNVAMKQAKIKVLEADLARERAKECNEGFPESTAIALIVVLAVIFVVVTVILIVLVKKEKSGTPIFYNVPKSNGSTSYTTTETQAKTSSA